MSQRQWTATSRLLLLAACCLAAMTAAAQTVGDVVSAVRSEGPFPADGAATDLVAFDEFGLGCKRCCDPCADCGPCGPCDPCGEVCGSHGGHGLKHNRADARGPAHIFGDHVHKRCEWMVEYLYMNMYMDGNRSGTDSLTVAEAFTVGQALGTNNAATPTNMTMEMHMLHIMYGMTDEVTLYVMPMWWSNTMDHLRATPFGPNPPLAGTPFTTHNSGFGDLVFGGLWKIYETEYDEWIVNLGFSVPTGDIDRTTTVPTGLVAQEFPYPMRLGSGTFDFRPGVTYKRFWEYWSMGLQAQFDLPLDRNTENYRMGNEYRANAWIARVLDCEKRWAVSFRVEGLFRSNFVGADPNLNSATISTNDPDMRGGEFVNFGYGVMYRNPKLGRLSVEAAHRVYQNLRGVQLETDWSLAASWAKKF